MDHLSDKPCLISHTLQKEVSEQYANKINQIGSYLFSFGYWIVGYNHCKAQPIHNAKAYI